MLPKAARPDFLISKKSLAVHKCRLEAVLPKDGSEVAEASGRCRAAFNGSLRLKPEKAPLKLGPGLRANFGIQESGVAGVQELENLGARRRFSH